MKSELAEQSRQAMIESCKRMTPQQRVDAYVELSRAHALVYAAGVEARRKDLAKESQHGNK